MFLSSSELFWVGIVYETLSDLAHKNDGGGAFECLVGLAAEFGVGGAALLKMPHGGPPASLPPDIRWAVEGELLEDVEQLSELRRRVAIALAGARAHLESVGGDGKVKQMEATASYLLHFAVAGFAPSTPRCLYSLGGDGEIEVLASVRPHNRGLFHTLLRLLAPYIDLPIYEHMALYGDCEESRIALEHWVPSAQSLDEHPPGWYPEKCLDVLMQEFIGNESQDTYKCAVELAAARNLLLDSAKTLRGPSRNGDAEASTLSASGADTAPKFHGVLDLLEALPDFISATDASGVDDSNHHEGRYGLAWGVCRALLAGPVEYCRRNGIDGAVEAIERVTHFLHDMDTQERFFASIAVQLAERRRSSIVRMCEQLAQSLGDVQKLIYGELRYKDSCSSDTTMGGNAQAGVPTQHPNIRETLRQAAEQLNNDRHAFPTLSALAPATEATLRVLAAKHLRQLNAYRSSDIIHELREAAARRDDQNLLFICSVAYAANALRNRVVHEPAYSYDRHHAHFLFHAIALILREV